MSLLMCYQQNTQIHSNCSIKCGTIIVSSTGKTTKPNKLSIKQMYK